jgi:hypothetical protein
MGWSTKGFTVRNLERIKFSGLIESRLILEDWPPVVSNPTVKDAFTKALVYFAENFFTSPRWQRINGKPVVYFYEVWSWQGSIEDFIAFRKHLDKAVSSVFDPLTGSNYEGVYIVADALYAHQQDIERLIVFDAITGYQPYPPNTTKMVEEGSPGWIFHGKELFTCRAFEDYHRLFQQWGQRHGIPIIPTAISRYNDRGVRGAVDHYAYPPASEAPFTNVRDCRNATLFTSNLNNQMRWADPIFPMLNINSWNEWFEDTAIEPVGFFPEGPYPDFFNQGDNVGTSTRTGFSSKVPDKIVVYGPNGHEWIDTPKEIKEKGLDLTQKYEWPCYGFDYLSAIKRLFGIKK